MSSGYLDATQITRQDEVDGLAVSPLVITYEFSIRFLSDFFNGDQYFKIHIPVVILNGTSATSFSKRWSNLGC